MTLHWRRPPSCPPPQMQTAATAAPAGLVLLDLSGRVTAASKHATALLGLATPAALVGRATLFEAGTIVRSDGTDLPWEEQPGYLVTLTGQPVEEVVLGLKRSGAEPMWLRVRAEPLTKVGAATPYAVLMRFVAAEPAPLASQARQHTPRPSQARGRRRPRRV